jgi:hypothetical protein
MACSKPVKALSFAAIVQGRESSVRVTDDGLGDVVDVVMVVTGKDCNQANEVLRRIDHALFDKSKIIMRDGRRYASLRDIITLIMVLPGKMAKELRSQFAEIIEDYIRQNLSGCPPEGTADQVGFKRKREELELLKLEHEINTLIVENKMKQQASIITASVEIERIRDPARSNLDDRTRLMIQDALQNSILTMPCGQGLLTNGVSPNAPISIGSVAAKLGYKPSTNDAKRIGGDLRKRYIKAHDKAPPKHDQLCDGRVTLVNSYTEQDRPLVEEALHAYFKGGETDDDA